MVGLAVAIVAMAFSYTIVLNIIMSLLCVVAVFEIVETTKASANKFILVVAMLYGALITYMADFTWTFPITLAYGFLMLFLLLLSYRTVRYELQCFFKIIKAIVDLFVCRRMIRCVHTAARIKQQNSTFH